MAQLILPLRPHAVSRQSLTAACHILTLIAATVADVWRMPRIHLTSTRWIDTTAGDLHGVHERNARVQNRWLTKPSSAVEWSLRWRLLL